LLDRWHGMPELLAKPRDLGAHSFLFGTLRRTPRHAALVQVIVPEFGLVHEFLALVRY
jgi:hypothetical protein